MLSSALVASLVLVCVFAAGWRRCENDLECDNGESCKAVPLGGDGYCVTTRPVTPTFPCPINFTYNQCCEDLDCTNGMGGVCVTAPTVPYCGGAVPPPWNACNYDGCLNETSCGARASCVPRGFLNFIVNMCVPGDGCRSDGDCRDGIDGQCSFFNVNPWCPLLTNVACTYSSSACRKDGDCAARQVCSWIGFGGKTECVDPIGPPPKKWVG